MKFHKARLSSESFIIQVDESGHKDMEYGQSTINSYDESEDYNDIKYDLINEINSDKADEESDDQKESSENPYAPNLDFLDKIDEKDC
jgi:hypothetical protein